MWDKMKLFFHVVKAGSFSKAAGIIGVTQPVMSRAVATLEDKIGYKLMLRNSRGITLTKKGEETFQVAQRMFMDMQGLKKNIDEKDEIKGKIRISTTHATISQIIFPYLLEFNREHEDISFEIVCNDHFIDIIQNEVDVAIRPYDEDNMELIQKHLLTLELGLYAHESYLDEYGVPTKPEHLDYHRMITYSRPMENPYSDVEWILKVGATRKRVPYLSVNSVECMMEAAEEGVGIISSYEEMRDLKRKNLKRILPDVKAEQNKIYFVYPTNIKKLKRIKQLESFLVEKLQK